MALFYPVLLDEFIDEPNFSESHDVVVAAPASRVYDSVLAVTPAEVPAFRLLMGMRTLPGRLFGQGQFLADEPLLYQFRDLSFKVLAEERPREIVVGAIGRFWRVDGGLHPFEEPAEFKSFAQPGFAKAALSFHLTPDDAAVSEHATLLTTETRVQTTDDHSYFRFALYWSLISWGSSRIREDWLRAIKERAESLT